MPFWKASRNPTAAAGERFRRPEENEARVAAVRSDQIALKMFFDPFRFLSPCNSCAGLPWSGSATKFPDFSRESYVVGAGKSMNADIADASKTGKPSGAYMPPVLR